MSGDKNARLAWSLAAAVGGMLALAYAASPLYDMFCRATGFTVGWHRFVRPLRKAG